MRRISYLCLTFLSSYAHHNKLLETVRLNLSVDLSLIKDHLQFIVFSYDFFKELLLLSDLCIYFTAILYMKTLVGLKIFCLLFFLCKTFYVKWFF